ncbi:hypothetical protein BC936DRAFT_147791 [Jimgerdemannia flammicorona]|uniref:Short-chain dehydrogenase/reductase SDR n=1 Tax=Jimgerdemannia flammicorona TaxID=994334 RepID=A0A433D4H5_9FUNG|nr:hypothetical protein BC936DRAFT_147791 [Jimgerdemannia flammicorona]
MSIDLKNKVALLFAKEGMHLAINYSLSRADAESTAHELSTQYNITAHVIQADVSVASEAERVVDETVRLLGRIDVLVNNAGTTTFCEFEDLEGLQDEDWDRILAVNTKAPFFTSRAAGRHMKKQSGGGCIINTTSIAASRTTGSSLAYCTSKAAMSHLTRCLAKAMAPEVRVNGVAPGFLRTRWGDKFSDEAARRMADAAVLKTATSTEECAAAYVYIAKNASVTGQIVAVDAGLSV